MFGAGKNQGAADIGTLQHIGEQFPFAALFDKDDLLADASGDRGGRRHRHPGGRAQHIGGELLDFRFQGGREEHGLPLFGQRVDNAAHIAHKPHIEHAVGFVEHQHGDVVEVRISLLHQVEQPPRRGHQQVGVAAQGADLGGCRHSTQQHGTAQGQMAAVVAQALVDLQGQLAGGGQDQGADRSLVTAFAKPLQNRQGKRRGLAGTGLRRGKQVFAGQQFGNGGLLDRRGLCIPFFFQGADNFLVELEVGETCRIHTILSWVPEMNGDVLSGILTVWEMPRNGAGNLRK